MENIPPPRLSSNEKTTVLLLAAFAVACIIFVLSPLAFGDVLLFFLSFPYAQIGLGLRALSLAGRVGNIIAYVLYFAICAVPYYIGINNRNKKREDAILFLIGMLAMWALYYLANPGSFPMAIPDVQIQNAVIGGTIHSMLLAYLVLKVIKYLGEADISRLGQWMGWGLHLLNLFFVIAVFGIGFGQMLASFEALRAGNVGNEHLLGITYVFITIRSIVGVLPFLLNIWVVFATGRLIKAFRADPYHEETAKTADSVAKVCKLVLAITAVSSAGFHFLQFFIVSRLKDVHSNINLPVTAILFMLGTLLLSRYIAANKRLKDENEGFI